MIQELIKIIEELSRVVNETGIGVNSDTIFEQAIKIYISGEIQKEKSNTKYQVKGEEQRHEPTKTTSSPSTKIIPPTEKQINFLKKSGYDGEIPETLEEAKILIANYIENQKWNNI